MGWIYACDAKKEIHKRKKMQKIDEIYKKCYSLYFAISHWNNSNEILEDDKNRLYDYIEPKINRNKLDDLEKDLNNWKKKINKLETKLKSNINTNTIDKGFFDIFALIKNIIKSQEERYNQKKLINNENDIEAIPNNISLSDLASRLQYENYLIGMNKNDYTKANKSNIDYKKVNITISEIMEQVINEFKNQSLIIKETNINNSYKQNINNSSNNHTKNNHKSFNNNNYNKNDINNNINDINIYNYNLNSFDNEEDSIIDFEKKLNNGLNPSNLILNIPEEMNQEDFVKNLQSNLEINDCFILPQYNLDKLINSTVDLNSVAFDSKNVYHKIFPMVENDENKLASKKLIDELEPPNFSTIISDKSKINKNIDLEKDTRYEFLTPLQKLIILYGIFTTGNNPYLINCILNSYYSTRCILYNSEEMKYICSRILEEIGIEYEPNFYNMKENIFNNDKSNNFNLSNSHKVDIESACFISEYSDFEYNNTIRKILDIKDEDNKDAYNQIYHNIKNKDQYKLNSNFNINNKNMFIQNSNIFTKLITKNPYLNKSDIKKNIISKLITYLKDLCDKIKQFQTNNKSGFNYFTGEIVHNNTKQKNDLNYKEIIENKNKKLNKTDVLNLLKENKNRFGTYSIKKIKAQNLKKEEINKEEDIKNEMLCIINSYHDYNIKNNWESMNKVWYQNNQRFNPILKKDCLIKTNNIDNIKSDLNKTINKTNNIFSHVQSLKTNQ